MNNFFYDSSDFTLFKKALKKTGGEPVVINILSTDSSLKTKEEVPVAKQVRKNFSSRFEPSPFDKFFGPTKKRTTAIDTNNFSSWKNKNYRNVEKTIDENPTAGVKFSLSDFMNNKFGKTKFNELDQAKSNIQKPITQISSDDPMSKRFSLDSFMTKLEQQRQVEDELKNNDDILEPLGEETQKVVPDSSQDEDFGSDNEEFVNKIVYDDNIEGGKFRFEREELDKIKNRLMKIEEEQEKLKNKSNEKFIESDELSKYSSKKDDFDLRKLGFEPIEGEEDQTEQEQVTEEKVAETDETHEEEAKVEREDPLKNYRKNTESTESVNKSSTESTETDENTEAIKQLSSELDKVEKTLDKIGKKTNEDLDTDKTADKKDENEEPLTRKEFKSITNEFMDKFSKIYTKESKNREDVSDEYSGYETENPYRAERHYFSDNREVEENQQYLKAMRLQRQQAELESKIAELIEANKQNDKRSQQQLQKMEAEKQRIAEEYEKKLSEIEASYNQKYEDYKKKAILEKINSEIEANKKTDIKKKKGVLKKELKTSLDKSNSEMDKKLLEVAAEQGKNQKIKQRRQVSIAKTEEKDNQTKSEKEKLKANIDLPKPKPTKQRKKKSTRHRIDGDIISDVDFE